MSNAAPDGRGDCARPIATSNSQRTLGRAVGVTNAGEKRAELQRRDSHPTRDSEPRRGGLPALTADQTTGGEVFGALANTHARPGSTTERSTGRFGTVGGV
jgi:hypothetical protein